MLGSILGLLLEFTAVGLAFAATALALQAGAAIFLGDRSLVTSSRRPSIAVLIPAHDEEENIETTLLRIKEDLLPSDRLLVVADNCVDQTAVLAAQAGADIVVRSDSERHGKGFALAAGLRRLAAMAPEVVVFVDADCQVSPHGLEMLARASSAAHAPIQCLNLMVANPDSSSPPRLAEFAWRIKNDLRPNGYARLGLPCHLLGTGMAIPWQLIEPELFATGHLAEDMRFGLELAMRGHPPRFFRDTRVISYFPDTQRGQDQQKQRWVHGHLALINSHLPRLICHGLGRRDLGLLALAADLAVPPLGVLAVANIVLGILCLAYMAVTGAGAPLVLAALANILFAFSIITAWYVCGRDMIGGKEITQLPLHVIRVIRSVFNLARGRRTNWIRADRHQTTIRLKRGRQYIHRKRTAPPASHSRLPGSGST
jgi:cellulose synthase/poly-beta-1,6-N-acetylglucosamine synthase-like glycosyltransferase